MVRVTYVIVEHDGGWAYKVGDVFSETFPTHDTALAAARIAAAEQQQPGETPASPGKTAPGNGMRKLRTAISSHTDVEG